MHPTRGPRKRPPAFSGAARYRSFFDDAPLGMCRIAPNGEIVEANRALAGMLGCDEAVWLRGERLRAVCFEPAAFDRLLERAGHEGWAHDLEMELWRRDGSVILACVTARPADPQDDESPVWDVIVDDRTERRRTEEALRETEERVRKYFQTSLDAITVNTLSEGTYVEVNDEFVRLTGYTREEVIGRSAVDIGIWRDPDQLRFVLREIARSGIVRNLEGEFRAKDGSIVSALFSAERITIGAAPCILSVVRDVRDRKRAEAAIRESERRYRALFEESNDVIFISDANGVLVDVNPAGVALLGLDSKEELLRTGNATVFYEHPEIHSELVERLRREGQLKNVEIDMRRKDGVRIKVALNATPLHDSRGNAFGVLGSLRDITERTRLQEQLLQSQRMEAVGRLAGGVAHDFNNLLTVIRSSAGLALLGLAPDHPARPRLEEVDEAAQRSAELTGQLLAFARRQVISPQTLDLNELIVNLRKMLRRVIGEDVELITRLAPDLGPVRADRGQLEQVVMNLAVNARDAMPRGGTLSLETANVVFGPAEERPIGIEAGRYVRLMVSDAGVGMSEEVRAHLFEPFFTTKDIGRGTGLGLATCYGIVRQSGGSIDVESEPGRGASFRVLLPRVDELPEAVSPVEPRVRAGGQERIVVLEDDPMVRRITAQVLRERGYKVVEAASADEALALAEGPGGEAVDLLVSDVVLPKMNGVDVAERVRQIRPRIKVLFFSGHADDALLGRLRECGAAFLQKPFPPDTLAENVRRVLDATS